MVRERGEEEGLKSVDLCQADNTPALPTVGSLLHKHSLDTGNNARTS